jgi:hypothetical protein
MKLINLLKQSLLLEEKNLGIVSFDVKDNDSFKKAFNELLDKCVSTLPDFKEKANEPFDFEKGVYNLNKEPNKRLLIATVSIEFPKYPTMGNRIKNIELYLSPSSEDKNKPVVRGNSINIRPEQLSPDMFKKGMYIALEQIISSIMYNSSKMHIQ